MSSPTDLALDFGEAVTAAAAAAKEEVLLYAATFQNREDYEPLEDLAARVERKILETALERLKA